MRKYIESSYHDAPDPKRLLMLIVLIFPPRWMQARVLAQGGIQWLRTWLVVSHRLACMRLKGNLWEYKETKTKLTLSLSWQSVEGSGPKGESRCKAARAGGLQMEEVAHAENWLKGWAEGCSIFIGCSPLPVCVGSNPEGHRHKSGVELERMAVIWAHDACVWEPRQGPLGESLQEEICADASVNLGSSLSVGA